MKDNIKYLGFGEKLYPELEKNMQQRQTAFQLKLETEFNKDKIGAVLNFKKSDNSEMYFFNNYVATLEKANNEKLSQTIYLNKGQGITMKETYNLLNSRAVNTDLTTKEGQKYNAWIQMDFKETDANGNFKMKQFHQNYGYNLEQALTKLPIKELATETDKNALIQSLKKGNRQAVTFEKEGKEQRHYIEANPQYKTISVYDGNMQRVNNQVQKEKESQDQSTKQDAKKEVKAGDEEGEAALKSGQKSKKKRRVSVS